MDKKISEVKFKAILESSFYKTKIQKTDDKFTFHFIVSAKKNLAKLKTKESLILLEDFERRINEYHKPLFLVFEHCAKDLIGDEKFDSRLCCGQFESIKFYKGNWHFRGFIFPNKNGTVLRNLLNAKTKFVLNLTYNKESKEKIFPLNFKIEPVGI